MPVADKPLPPFTIPFSGYWRPAFNPLLLEDGDFSKLMNFRYCPNGIRAIQGITKQVVNALSTYPAIRAGMQFKNASSGESHVLVQAWNAAGTASVVYDKTDAVPGTADFGGTVVHTDAAGAGTANMVAAPNEGMVYCNGMETLITGGREMRVGAYIDLDLAGSYSYDYTTMLSNSIQSQYATIHNVAGTSTIRIGSTIPLKGIKFYVKTPNASAATAAVNVWTSSGYAAVTSLSDGTAVGGKTLAQTGTMSFADTSPVAVITQVNSVFLYFYTVTLTSADAATAIYQVTLDTAMVPLTDIWDGIAWPVSQAYSLANATYLECTLPLHSIDYYSSAPTTTYQQQQGGWTGANGLLLGFTSQMQGLSFAVASTNPNQNLVSMTVKYWNGSAFATVGTVNDGTTLGGKSLSQNGVASWTPPSLETEFKTNINNNNVAYYYYFVQFSAGVSVGLFLDAVFGVPAPKAINGFKFPVLWQNRTGLGCETSGRRNMLRLSAYGTSESMNGADSIDLFFGDESELMAGGGLTNRYGGTMADNLVVCKASSTYMVDGVTPQNYRIYEVSTTVGCPSPQTFRVCDIGLEISPGINKHIAIWHTGTGVVMFDQNAILDISIEIQNYWQNWRAEYINTAMIDKFQSFYDNIKSEYHLMIATGSSTVLDTELVFDLARKRWSNPNRGSTKRLSCGFPVSDTLGNKFTYVCDANGLMYQLENGMTFDGAPITSTVKTKPQVHGSIAYQSTVRRIRPICSSRNITTNKLAITHYGDLSATGTTIPAMSLADATHSITAADATKKSVVLGPNVFHEYEISLTANNESIGLELIAITGQAQVDRVDIGG